MIKLGRVFPMASLTWIPVVHWLSATALRISVTGWERVCHVSSLYSGSKVKFCASPHCILLTAGFCLHTHFFLALK